MHMTERRPLPEYLRAGVTLDNSDVDALHALLAQRDQHIEKIELELNALKQAYESASAPALMRQTAFASHWITRSLMRFVQMLLRLVSVVTNAVAHTRWFCIVALVIQLPLVFNLGYYNHDELQWLAFADQPSLSQVPWNGWFEFHQFQFRPLTFNLWLLISHFFGYQPIPMHLLRVSCGIVVALLLRAVFVRLDMPARRAALSALIFLMLPEVAFTHAWIGTYADSLCLGFLLGAILWTLRSSASLPVIALPIAALTALALLSKESAIVIPALLLIAAFKRRDRTLIIALASSTLVVAAYLYLRLDTILFAPRDSTLYQWSLANIPDRLGEYAIFPFLVDRLDVSDGRWDHNLYFSIICLCVFVVALANAGWRYLATFCIGWIGAMGPTLILTFSANHYAYISAALACGVVGLAWSRLDRVARCAIALLLIVLCVHSIEIAKQMRHIGRVQHNLYHDLATVVPASSTPILIKPLRNEEDFILQRVTHDVQSYHRIEFGDRVRAIPFADSATAPTHWMAGDGRLKVAN
jgi:hypothetical protein